MNTIFLALESLLTRYLNLHKAERDSLPTAQFEEPWPSPCVISTLESDEAPGSSNIQLWRPVKREADNIFADLEKALERPFHTDIRQFYGSFWSNGICVERDDINFSLIQVWNEEDQEQLKENLLGHAFARIKGRLPLTFFIGCTGGNDMLCLDNDSGQVVLEKPGRKAHKVLSPTLETFLLSLQPTLDTY